MNSPDTARVLETFIAVPIRSDATSLDVWQDYLTLLRTEVSPLVRRLQQNSLVSWYSFVVYAPGDSDTPTGPGDTGLAVHLRLEMSVGVDESQLRSALPAMCRKTRPMPGPDPHALSGIDFPMRDSKIAHAWRVLGESSDWILSMLDAHAPDQSIPPQHVAQFLHLVGNQLMAGAVRIPMP